MSTAAATTALRREVDDYLARLGAASHGHRASQPGTRYYYLPVPGVPLHHDDDPQQPFLQIEVTVQPVRCKLAMDRLLVHRLSRRVEPWFADTWVDYLPSSNKGHAIGGWLSRWGFGSGTYAYRPARFEDLLDLLRRWVEQELAWQALPDAAEFCFRCNSELEQQSRRSMDSATITRLYIPDYEQERTPT